MRRWVVDTSPLLFLSKLDRLELLRKSADSLLVPPAVWSEVEARRDEATERVQHALRAAWLELRKPMDSPGPDLESLRGIGEIEVLLLAQEVDAERVVLDDLNARREARRRGLTPVGTLGLLLAARLRGEVTSLAEEIHRLEEAGFRASPALIAAVLRSAGEQP
jgi:hypothetical protein